jgi:Rieske 2Fe-2S family protein
VYYYAILPNLLLNLHPDYMLTFTMWPRAVDRTDVICEWHFHPEADRAARDFDPRSAIEFLGSSRIVRTGSSRSWPRKGSLRAATVPATYSNREELLQGLDRFVLERTAPAARAAGPLRPQP